MKDKSGMPIVKTMGVTKAFHGVVVLDGIDVELEPGTVTALLGENGAGKSTLLKIMAGVYQPDQGQLYIRGKQVTLPHVHAARDLGVAFVHQELHLVPNRTVAQNILLGWEPVRLRGTGLVNQATCREIARTALALVGAAGVDVDAKVHALSPAQQQLVEIAKALAWPEVQVLLLDEPTSSLPQEQSQNILSLIESLRDRGLSIVLTTHKLSEAFAVADRIVVMRDGRLMQAVDPQDATVTREQVVEWMVGRPMNALFPAARTGFGDPVLEVRGLTGGMVHDVNFSLRQGEVLGVGGLVGAGRTEMARLLFQTDPVDNGTISIRGKTLSGGHPHQAIQAGIALVPEDRKEQGLVQIQTVMFNMSLASLDIRSTWLQLKLGEIRSAVKSMIDSLHIKTTGPQQSVNNLSGGNQQKVVLGKWLTRTPGILILDEPTRGVDVGARAEIYDQIDAIARDGVGIILISSDMEELIGMSDRVLVMSGGTMVGELKEDEIAPSAILALASEGIKV
ncbi:MAG: sugar ABC transporter ATP-binding protein [Propioniciclava sp.]